MKKLILVLMVLALVGTVIADDSYTFKLNEPFTLEVSMANANLSPCYNCACNYSIFYPNGSALIKNIEGTTLDGYCHITTSTNVIGIYGAEMSFTNGIDFGRTSFYIVVNTTGKQSGNLYIPIFLWIGGFALMGVALYNKNEFVGLFSGMIFILAGIYMMIYGLGSVLDNYTRGMSYVSLGFGLIICFIAIIEMFYNDEDNNET